MTEPTGRIETRSDHDVVAWTRTFTAPIDDVWAAITESERLARWIGTWTGDPADGFVMFTMNAEEGEAAPARYDVLACEPPRLVRVENRSEWGHFDLTLELTESAGVTTLTFCHAIHDAGALGDVGPGWEYYLDRLAAAETGGDPSAVDWDTYYPAQKAYYDALR